MTPEVEIAIQEIRAAFPTNQIDVTPEDQGGAYVVVHGVELGERHTPSQSWLGFLIGFQYPRSDVYPHFVDAGLKRADGQSLGSGFSGPVEWQKRQAFQVSRRSNRWDPTIDTALTKLQKVIEWIRTG